MTAIIQIPQLPAAISLSGQELLEIVQNGVSLRCTSQQIASIYAPANLGVTQKQIRAWAASTGSPLYIYTIDNACPADIANIVNIQWNHGNTMAVGDPLYLFIQSTLGFSSAQMSAAFTVMQTYPQ